MAEYNVKVFGLPPNEEEDKPTSNKDKALAFYNLAFNDHKPEEAVRLYMGRTYTQHSPTAANGPEGFIKYVKTLNPGVEIKRVLADGDLVAIHSHFPDLNEAVVDIYRFEDGKIIEHWDVTQQIPTKSANDNGMF